MVKQTTFAMEDGTNILTIQTLYSPAIGYKIAIDGDVYLVLDSKDAIYTNLIERLVTVKKID